MSKQILTKEMKRKSFINWMCYNLSLYQPETMQAPALVKMFGDIREDLYPNDVVKQQELMARHLPFFNTEPFLGAIIPGIALGMEAEKAAGADIPDDLITAIKSALMGPFAGIGDALLAGTFVPILLAIACGLSGEGQVTGVFFYIIAFLGVMVPLTWYMFNKGCDLGASAAELILGNDLKDDIINSLNVVGLIVVGSIAAAYSNITLGYKYIENDVVIVDLNALINGVWPKLPVYLVALGSYYLIAKKNWSATKLILLYLVVAVVGTLTGILVV